MTEVFEYHDYIYHNNDPLVYLIEMELNDYLRKSYWNLNGQQRFIVHKIIINESSIEEVARILDTSYWNIKEILYDSLLTLLLIFEEKYYRKTKNNII